MLLLGYVLHEQQHLPLGGVVRFCLALLGSLLPLSEKGVLNVFKSFKKLANTLRYRDLGEGVVGVPHTWAHAKVVTHQFFVVKGP